MGLNLGPVSANRDKLRTLAMAGAARSPFRPDVPTLKEFVGDPSTIQAELANDSPWLIEPDDDAAAFREFADSPRCLPLRGAGGKKPSLPLRRQGQVEAAAGLGAEPGQAAVLVQVRLEPDAGGEEPLVGEGPSGEDALADEIEGSGVERQVREAHHGAGEGLAAAGGDRGLAAAGHNVAGRACWRHSFRARDDHLPVGAHYL